MINISVKGQKLQSSVVVIANAVSAAFNCITMDAKVSGNKYQ